MQSEDMRREKEEKGFLFKNGHPGKENFMIMALVGVLFLVIAWPVNREKKVTQSGQSDTEKATMDLQVKEDNIPEYAQYLEESLERLLSTMEGVGKVRVMVTLEGTGEVIVEKDQNSGKNASTEVDSSGGSRNTSNITMEEATVFYESSNGDTPIVKQKRAPKVVGVAVSAQGGGNAATAGNIKKAIQALFGIDAHNIIIVKMISQ